ncbi:MAG: sugar ABC transporter substrate-binding protein [Firmicutes bacterium]|nr:sugar ABC transporter substrate-binding protein [Bacillota bacterium]
MKRAADQIAVSVTVLLLMIIWSLSISAQVTLRVVSWVDYTNPVHVSGWPAVLEAFEKAHPDIKIEFYPLSGYWQKTPIMLAAGEVDVLDMTLARIPEYVTSGMLLDLTPYVNRDLNMRDYHVYSLDRGRYPYPDGPIWTIWTMMSPTILYYNTSLFEKAGLPAPPRDWTYEKDLVEFSRKLLRIGADGTVEQYPISNYYLGFTDRTNYGLGTIRHSFGAQDYTPDGKRFALDTPENIRAWEFVDSLRQAGFIGAGYEQFLNGSVAIQFHSPWLAPRAALSNISWSTAFVPIGPAGRRVPLHGNPSIAIASTTPHPDEAWTFIRYILTTQTATSVVLAGNIPTKKSAALEWLTMSEQLWPGFRPETAQLSIESSFFTPAVAPAQPEADSVIIDTLRRAERGEIPVATALAEATRLANAILEEREKGD